MSVIRGGTSRGVYVAEGDLPSDITQRTEAVLRLFRGASGVHADGLGGENPVLRKVALLAPDAPGPDGAPSVKYRFGQVDEHLTSLSHAAECGNIAAGVPLFASLEGWAPAPSRGAGVWITFVNSGQRARAEWLETTGTGGRLRLTFLDAAPVTLADALPEGRSGDTWQGPTSIRFSVIRGLNTYLLVRGTDLGLPDPLAPEAAEPGTFDLLEPLVSAVALRLGPTVSLKVALVAEDPADAGAVRARILYVPERRTHPSFAVTGATTLAVARCIPGSVLHATTGAGTDLRVHHPAGTMALAWSPRPDGLPAGVALERDCRLILRGEAY